MPTGLEGGGGGRRGVGGLALETFLPFPVALSLEVLDQCKRWDNLIKYAYCIHLKKILINCSLTLVELEPKCSVFTKTWNSETT